MITYDDFLAVDMRIGRIVSVEDFSGAHKPTYVLMIDFGPEIGVKKSTSQIVTNYSKELLIGSLVLGVVNFPPKQI